MIQKIISLCKIDKDKVDKWRKSIIKVEKSVENYFFLRGITIKKVWLPAAAGILCGAMLIVGASTIKANAVDSLPVVEENLIEAYAVYYRGKHIGIIENKEQADAILNSIQADFQQQYDMETILNEDIELEEILTENNFLSNLSDIKKTISKNIDVQVKASVLEINGKEVAVLKDEEIINYILEKFRNRIRKLH